MNTIIIPADDKQIPAVQERLVAFLKGADASASVINKTELALEEILINIIRYGYEKGEGEIHIEYGLEEDSKKFFLQITDQGTRFNPLEKEEPNIHVPASQRQIGGLGIFLVKKVMDTVEYEYKNSKNILTMKKTLL
jgi:anti-sigma regulatory factor (Ser/Thr protein kinase)